MADASHIGKCNDYRSAEAREGADSAKGTEKNVLWHYFAPDGSWQGPYKVQQLTGMRSVLPMDSWLHAATQEVDPCHAAGEPGSSREAAASCPENSSFKQGPAGDVTSTPSTGDEFQADATHWLLLAEVLGDDQLLAAWRSERGITEATNSMAPPAAVFEERIRIEAQEAQLRGSPSELSREGVLQAVLAGLPEHDEARQLADLAASGGNSLEDLVRFSHKASRSRSPRTVDWQEQEAVDEAFREESAFETGDRRGGSLDWRKRKRQKKAAKLSKRNAWLYS